MSTYFLVHDTTLCHPSLQLIAQREERLLKLTRLDFLEESGLKNKRSQKEKLSMVAFVRFLAALDIHLLSAADRSDSLTFFKLPIKPFPEFFKWKEFSLMQ